MYYSQLTKAETMTRTMERKTSADTTAAEVCKIFFCSIAKQTISAKMVIERKTTGRKKKGIEYARYALSIYVGLAAGLSYK